MNQEIGSLRQSIAICQIAGCRFAEEEMADFEKVERGELTFDDIIVKLHKKLSRLKQEQPDYFEII